MHDKQSRLTPSYDGLGWLYDMHWRGLWPQAMAVLDRIILHDLPPHARILDLGCGTGHLAAALVGRGYDVTGIDISVDMLRYARENAPGAAFVCADAREFKLRPDFDLVISTFDSMNHMLTEDELERAFVNVRSCLKPGGRFIFDLNMAKAFENEWWKSSFFLFDDHTYIMRGGYDRTTRIGRTDLTLFRLEEHWTRQDFTVFQRCYTRREVRDTLAAAGFASSRMYTASNLDMRSHLAVGRAYFAAITPGARVRRRRGTLSAAAAG